MRAHRVPTVAGLALVVATGVASAHGATGSRFDAPLPLPLLYAGAAVTVLLTGAWLAASDAGVGTDEVRELAAVSPGVARVARAVGRWGFLAAFVGVVVAGLVGPTAAAENPATTFAWPVWLKGLGLVAVVAGSPWRVLSPWRTLYDLLSRLEGRDFRLFDLPERVGVWPALVAYVVGVGIVENLTAVPRSPRATAGVVAGYAALMLLGGVAFGPSWFRRGDALAVLYRLLARVAPVSVTRTDDGGYAVGLDRPWTDCLSPVQRPGAVAFVVATVYTVSFDGFTATSGYQAVAFAARGTLGSAAGVGVYLVGLAGFVLAFHGVAALCDRTGGVGRPARAAAAAFAPTVVPIAAAYEVAHTYPYVLRNLGRTLSLLVGAVAGVAPEFAPLAWLSLPAFWGSQVVLVVGGHVVAVVAAHAVAVRRYGAGAAARNGHLPMLGLMVGYTVLSLWIVSQPVVAG